jgi:sulfite exporter TauE/SafE
MQHELTVLVGSAALIASVHTVIGPDHYLPFVALSKARQWSRRKTLWITAVCGAGHVAGSVVLGLIGIGAGITVRSLELFESQRGEIAAWLLVGFGLLYGAWGLRQAIRNKPHTHVHAHANGTCHSHTHSHHKEHAHPHGEGSRNITPWILFTIFVFGPCEPLIPLLMYPAAALNAGAVVLVAGVFALVTIATMLGLVYLSCLGMSFVSTERIARYGHALAGATVFLCGLGIQLGL